MISKGQRVRVEFPGFDIEGTVLQDCDDWLCDPLIIRDDFDGKATRVATHLACDVLIIPPEIVDTGEEHDAHVWEWTDTALRDGVAFAA